MEGPKLTHSQTISFDKQAYQGAQVFYYLFNSFSLLVLLLHELYSPTLYSLPYLLLIALTFIINII